MSPEISIADPVPGVRQFTFSGTQGSLSRTVNAYLLKGDPPVLIDCGFAEEGRGMGACLSEIGPAAGLLLLTHLHRDHAGGAEPLDRRGYHVFLHRDETRLYADRVSRLRSVQYLDDGQSVGSGLGPVTALHTPGHSRGHLCFHWEEGGVLFSGDLVTGEPSSWVGPPDGEMADYLNSLRRVARLPLRLLLSGHGRPVHDPAEVIEAYLQRRLEREEEILRLLGEKPARIPDLTLSLYRGRGLRSGLLGFAEKTVEAHLDKLIREGRVRRSPDGDYSVA